MVPAKRQKGKSGRPQQTISQHRATSVGAPAQQCPETDSISVPVEIQQKVLDIFRRAFPFDHDTVDLKATIQEVKGHLFQRDFSHAFAKPEYLDAYALRWSASRALGYTSIFLHGDLEQVWLGVSENVTAPASTSSPGPSLPSGGPPSHAGVSRVLCIGGGGGAEVAACAAAARTLSLPSQLSVHVVDIADWSRCIAKLEKALCTVSQISNYASESAKAAHQPFISSDSFNTRFSQHDILAVSEAELKDITQHVHLCTIMFTLNEFFSASIAKATAFLLALTDAMPSGSWLLVVDSPGSYSDVRLGSNTKQYPMKWLLDHTLLDVVTGKDDKTSKWKKIVSDDSRWFRLIQQSLKYPIELENMRYQIHLFQRLGSTGS